MAINTSDFRKGLKVEIDGDPYLMVECNFVKPGKGTGLYKCKLKNLLRNTILDRTYRAGESLEEADVVEKKMQYLYQNGDRYVFMDPDTYEQPELTAEAVGDDAKWLSEGLECDIMFHNGQPIAFAPPNHLVYEVTYAEEGAKGNTATNVTKPVEIETGAEIQVPIFIKKGDKIKVDTRTGEYLERSST